MGKTQVSEPVLSKSAVDEPLESESLDSIVRNVADALGVQVSSFYQWRADDNVLELAATVGLNTELVGSLRLRPDQGLTGLVADPGVHSVGLSGVLDLTIAANVRQAREQADRAAAIGPGMQSYGDEPTRGLTSLVDAATTASWAVGYLGELTAVPEGPELMDTLRAWLDQHGQVDAAAQRLGIHRHTVRHRIRRAEAVLGRQLDDPEVRADLWFALDAVRSRSAPPERQ